MMDPIHTGGLYDFLLTALEVRDRALGQRQKYSGPWGRRLPCPGQCCRDDPTFTARMCFCGEGPTGSLVLPLLKGLGKGSYFIPALGSLGPPACSRLFQAASLSITGEGRPPSLQTMAEAELESGWSRPGRWVHPSIGPFLHGARGRQASSPSAWPLSQQSCYEHIQKEDMHRFPGRWDSKDLW